MLYLFNVTMALFLVITPLILHEMGHWAVLRRYGVGVTEHWLGLGPVLFRLGKVRVGMLPIGAAVVPDEAGFAKLSPRQRMNVALAGPAVSFLYGAAGLLVWWFNRSSSFEDGLFQIAMLNFLLAGVNLLPIPPLDGFQALAAWLEHRKTPMSSQRMALAQRLGNGLVYGIGFFVIGLALVR